MSVGAIGSYSLDSSAIRSWMTAFRSGQTTISKDDITEIESELDSEGVNTSSLSKLLQDYDEIDLDGNGIGFSELLTYAKTQKAAGTSSGEAPKSMSIEELTTMRDNLSDAGDSEGASSLSQVIENFDEADTDQDGTVSFEEYKTYAEAHDLTLPKPPKPTDIGDTSSADESSESSEDTSTETEASTNTSSTKGIIKLLLERYSKGVSSYSQVDFKSLLEGIQG